MVESENNCRSVVQYTFMRKILGSWIPPKNPNKILNTIIGLSVHMNFSKSRLLSVRHVKFIADFVEMHRLQTIFCCFFSYFSLMFTIFSGYNVHMILK